MNTLEAFHMRCQRHILDIHWWVHVSNVEVLQRSGLVTSYVIDAYLCLAMLHAWTLEYQHMMSDGGYLRRQKGKLEKTARSASQRLDQQDSGSTAIYAVEI